MFYRVHLFGHSQGSYLAQCLMRARSERVASVTLSATCVSSECNAVSIERRLRPLRHAPSAVVRFAASARMRHRGDGHDGLGARRTPISVGLPNAKNYNSPSVPSGVRRRSGCESIQMLATLWHTDRTKLDILVLDADGRTVRPWLTVVVDDHSRTIASYSTFVGRCLNDECEPCFVSTKGAPNTSPALVSPIMRSVS